MTNPDPKLTNPEAALGGADAVETITDVSGLDASPGGPVQNDSAAHPPAGSGPNYLMWGVGSIVALVALTYLLGLMG